MKSNTLLTILLVSQSAVAQMLTEGVMNDPVQFEYQPQLAVLEPKFETNLPKTTIHSVKNLEQSVTLERKINQSILQQKWQYLPELLHKYQHQPNYDKALAHYAWGAFFYAKQQHKKAISYYQKFLTLKPELAYPRFDYGVMLFENRQYRQAQVELQKSYPQLEPVMQRLAQKYLIAISEQQRWQPYLNLQYTRTNNVNNASTSKVVQINGLKFIKDTDALPQKAEGIRYGVGIVRELNIISNHFIHSEFGYDGVYYWNNKQYNEQSVHFELGYAYRTARQSFSFVPFIEQNWLGSARYNKQFGASLTHYFALNPHWQLHTYFVHTQKHYRTPLISSRHNGFQHRLINSLRWQAVKNWQFFVSLELMQDKVKEKASSSYKLLGAIGASYQSKNWNGRLSVSYGNRYFNDIHYLYRYKRQDEETQINWVLGHNQLAWKGFVPKLNFRYQKIKSSIPDFYSRSSKELFLTVDKSF
ncbi:DUF560 domain-containing protein [Haemophilus haemoglobinophilus]|nr:DUF560 domain-containing protein [Canicola haemoglobinophilus]